MLPSRIFKIFNKIFNNKEVKYSIVDLVLSYLLSEVFLST